LTAPSRNLALSAPHRRSDLQAGQHAAEPACCPLYHEAIELIGRRWTGAIVEVLLQAGEPLRFSEIAHAVPQLSDRMLSERMKELEERGVVERRVEPGPPVKVEYELTPMGRSLQPALAALKAWAREWLDPDEGAAVSSGAADGAGPVHTARSTARPGGSAPAA
jgi:DNA-binding HxlR family transcriptional regulator